MPDYSIDLSTMFNELPFFERFEKAARLGFNAVELSLPYAIPKEALARQLRDCRQTLIAFDLPHGNREQEECGVAWHPDRISEFREGVCSSVDYAAAVGCRLLNCMVGRLPRMTGKTAAHQTLVDNLRYASRRALAEGIRILVELVDTGTTSDSYLHGTEEAVSLLDAVGTRNIALHCNISRMHALGEPVEAVIKRHLARIGHLRISSRRGNAGANADRIDYERLFGFIDSSGHQGWVGLGSVESVEAGLAWMSRHGNPRVNSRWGIPLQAFRGAAGEARQC
jgi:hydroxypyruvate isomerase